MRKKAFLFLMTVALLLAVAIPAMGAVEDTGFADVDAGAWYADAVEYCRDNSLMNGTTDTAFEPEAAMTRAMLATVLYHAAGSPQVAAASPFTDVAEGSWYADAAVWAQQNNVISGYGGGLFGTDDPVTREQIATMLWNYENSPSAERGSDFADEGAISSYASTAVDWARAEGIVNGKEGNRFDPQGNATRAEVAAMLLNYMSKNNSAAPAPDPESTSAAGIGTKILVAYFSATGNTRPLAEYVSDALDADLYEIIPEIPYTAADLNYGDSSSRATVEMNDPSARPAISGSVENMEEYDVVFLGYPIWWGQAPRIVGTFLESYDLSGKTIVPFCTSGSSGIGSSAMDLHDLASGADWLSGQRFSSGTSRSAMVNWINGLDLGVAAE